MLCYSCSKNIELSDNKIFRSDTCPHCKADLRCCKNCEFYDRNSQWECRESISENVKEKERANYCDYLRAKLKIKSEANGDSSKAKALAEAEKLFKKF
jgi:hypothetical protein